MTDYKNEKPQHNLNRRIGFFLILFFLLLVTVLAKLFEIQVIDSSKYKLAAKKQYESKISLKPSRGIIFDRKMNALVSNSNSYSFAADPNMVDNKDSVAELFAHVFKKDKGYYLERLNAQNTSFVWLERRTEPEFSELLKDINISGVIKLNESHRVTNYDQLASQIIGVTDIDNNGISGTELGCDELLSGKDGYVVMQKDGLGRKRPAIEYPRKEPQNGDNVVLTIDLNVQKIIEEELGRGVNVNDAEGGKCVVMSVKTGEILGMYSLLNNDEGFRNKLSFLTDLYEPGSTFKIVSAAASLEEGIENKNDVIQTYGGEYQFDGLKVKDSHARDELSFQQVIEQSSNIGMMQVALRLGGERFYKYARDFGFGITTGIDLPGEVKGYLKRPVEFSPVSLRYMAIGYEVLVSAIQMTNAYACIANNGVLMKPFVIKKLLSPNGSPLKEQMPTPVRNVISRKTARTLTELLYGVVERGTGKEAKIENVKIAGKTGTSQKLVDGQYSKKSYTASFIGYFPAEDPQIVVAVIIDAPKSGSYYGGSVAAPIFKKITERIIALGSLIDYSSPENYIQGSDVVLTHNSAEDNFSNETPSLNLTDFEISDAVRLLKESNIEYDIDGPLKNAVVIDQKVFRGNRNNEIKKVSLVTKSVTNNIKPVRDNTKMPDVKGLSLRKCVKVVSSLGLDYKINGSGRVINQLPEAGSPLTRNQQIVINCDIVN
jgi:cell division protein FtsI/penicillin-binding protein 2